jgi:predicted RNA-binding protein with PUA-like domain
MKKMKKGDRGFFYHTGDEKQIVGIVEVIEEYQPDPTDEAGKFGLVVVKAVKDMPQPVTLAAVKANPKLAKMSLVTSFRLSVQPVTDAEWKIVCGMGGLK